MLKKNMFLKEVPVIFLTSNNDKNHVVKAVQGGANDYIVKPIKQEILMDKIHTLLKEDKKGKLSWDDI
jgi:DNA-binding response OmpR family regulator